MRSMLHKVWLGVAMTAVVGLAGCGAPTTIATVRTVDSSQLEGLAIPPASAFKTFDVVVTKILPDDNSGLTHQNFVVKIAKSGELYNVNNSTTHGSEVVGLHVGEQLEIRGVVYKDAKSQGIHWTHHANKPGDAGWIKDEAGKVYE